MQVELLEANFGDLRPFGALGGRGDECRIPLHRHGSGPILRRVCAAWGMARIHSFYAMTSRFKSRRAAAFKASGTEARLKLFADLSHTGLHRLKAAREILVERPRLVERGRLRHRLSAVSA